MSEHKGPFDARGCICPDDNTRLGTCPVHSSSMRFGNLPDEIPPRGKILVEVTAERDRQDAKWGGIPGVERRDDHTYPAVLTEEVGEACQAWLERDVIGLRMELIQVAAVAVAWIEELDNGGAMPRA